MSLLNIENLNTVYRTQEGDVRAVEDVSFVIEEGLNFGLVGESACGKSTVLKSVIGVLPPNAFVAGGRILFEGRDLTTLGEEERLALATGIVSTLKYYDKKNLNSFNFSIYSISGETSYQLLIRIISRTPIQSYYLNDWTSFEALHSELTSNIAPEELCHEIRPFFP